MASSAVSSVRRSAITFTQTQRDAVALFRRMCKALPHVLNIYDMDMTPSEARHAIAGHFRKNSHVRDPRVVNLLIAKGQMELDETLLQYKQRSHLLDRLGRTEVHPFEDTFGQTPDEHVALVMKRVGL